jgi:uncharacterized tellurite resistance protein B-like protein
MINTIQAFLKKHTTAPVDDQTNSEQALRTATAALLMEVARADSEITTAERLAVERIVETCYGMSPDEAREVARSAERHSEEMTSLHPFTRLINSECSLDDRISIVRMLWDVTFADGHVDKHEEHLVRKVADLLYVPHSQFIRAKLKRGCE